MPAYEGSTTIGLATEGFFEGVECFIRFFEQHRRQRSVSLLAVPRTAAGRTQTIHQFDEVIECC